MEQHYPPQAPPRRRNNPTAPPENGEIEEEGSKESNFQNFIKLHNEAYILTDQGMKLDGENKKELAFKSYQKGLEFIDKAIQIAYEGGFDNDEEANKIDALIYKMRLTRKEILERISDLQHIAQGAESTSYLNGPSIEPPPYSAMPSTGEQSLYQGLNLALNDLMAEQSNIVNPLPINARELAGIPENVQIYFISPDGVSAPSYPTFLRIVAIDNETAAVASSSNRSAVGGNNPPPAFLQVGDWTYPLIPGQSPIFCSPEGIYIFPDLCSRVPGASVGLILPNEISSEHRKLIEDTLLTLAGLRVFPTVSEPESEEGAAAATVPSSKVSTAAEKLEEMEIKHRRSIGEKIAEGAEAISKGMVYGAEITSKYLNKGTTYLVDKIEPSKEPTKVSSGVKKGVVHAKTVTGKAVQLSGFLVSKVGQATLALGHTLAPHVHKTATKIIASSTKTEEKEASKKMDNVYEVTSGALVGFSTIYLGLEQAGRTLASSLATNTVTIVEHKYGNECGQVTSDGMEALGNTVQTGWNAKSLGPKGLAKNVAKSTGKAVLHNYKNKKEEEDDEKNKGGSN